jgi:hypothetical protein
LLFPGIRLGNFRDHKPTDAIQEPLNLINVVFEYKPKTMADVWNCGHLMKIALGTKIIFFLQMTRPTLIGRPAALCSGITKHNPD